MPMSVINVRHLYDAGLSKPAIDQLLSVDNTATNAGAYTKGDPGTHVWSSDPSGVFPSGDPTRDLTLTLYDKAGVQAGTRILRGTLTSSAGTVAVTNVSSSGLASSYMLVDDGTSAARADITFTFADGSQVASSLSWSAIDISTASSTPATGGGK